MAKLKKRSDGRYCVSVTINGKRKFFYDTTKAGAQAKLEAFQSKIETCRNYDATITVQEWSQVWLSIKIKEVAYNTYQSYEGNLRRYILPVIGFIPLTELNINHIRKIFDTMESNGLSSRTISYAQVVVKSMLEQAVDDEILLRNPARKLKRPKTVRTREMVTLTSAQVQEFLKVITSKEHYAFFKLAFASGLRRSELLGLRWSDIDFAHNTLTVCQTIVRINGHSVISPTTKTSSSHRTISIDDATMKVLKEHKIIINTRRMQTLGWINNDLVFPGISGGPRCVDEISKCAKRYAAAIGVPQFSMHGTRHTHATLLIQAGANLKVVQTRLGHASFEETMNTYTHVTPTMENEVVEILNKAF